MRFAAYDPRRAALLVLLLTTFIIGLSVSASSNAQNGPTRIMPLGNSITYDNHSGDTRPSSERISYRYPLWKLLVDDGYLFDFVGSVTAGEAIFPDAENEGWPGWQDYQIADSIYAFLTYNPADIVLLHIGTNGLDTDTSDVEDILNEIDRFETDNAMDIWVVLAKIINRSTYSATTTEFNNNIAAMAQNRINQEGDKIVIVDMENGAGINYDLQPAGDMYDNLHPNDDGYAKMANVWHAALQTLMALPDCPAGMTHYWKLEEVTAPPYIDSYGDNAATCTNCPEDTVGIVGNGQKFDGLDDEVNVPDDGSWDWGANQSFTIEYWMKKHIPCGGTAVDYNEVIVGRDDPGTSLHWWTGISCAHTPQGVACFQLRDTAGAGDAIYGANDLIDGEWHHVVCVRDAAADMNRLYVDGVKEDSLYFDYANGFGGTVDLNIGYLLLSSHYRYEGIVDEVATYDVALTDTEILAHYMNGLGGMGYCAGDSVAPMITSDPVLSGRVGELYSYDVAAAGNPVPHYGLLTYPAGMTIDSLTGLIEWTPTAEGDYPVEIEAYNSEGADTQSYMLNILEPGACPVDMISYWKLDETSGTTYTDFYGGNDGSASPSPPSPSVDAVVGGAQDFNGTSNYITAPDNDSFDWSATSSFSIECWCRFTTIGGQNKVMVGRDQSGGNPHWWLGARSSDGFPIFYLLDSSSSGDFCLGSAAINNDAWHHLVAVRDESVDMIRLYVDGVKVDSTFFDYGAGFGASTQLDIGYMAYNYSPQYYYDGLLDEVALYDRALNEAEIALHYSNGLLGIGYCSADSTAPAITSIPDTIAYVGELYSYSVDATGYPSPHYALLDYPAGMSIDSLSGVIEWTPAAAGEFDVSVEAYNSEGADTQSYSITVEEAPPCPVEMIHYWKLDETVAADYVDDVGGNDATCVNCPAPVTGAVGGAQFFDGSDDEVYAPDDGTFDWNKDASFSICYWMKTGASTSGNRVVISRDDPGTNLHWWIGCDDTGRERFQLRDVNGDGAYIGDKGNVLNDDEWHFVVAVRDNSVDMNRIYVDGVKIDSAYHDYAAGFESNVELNIGYIDLSGHYRFEGIIDEVAVFDKALTGAEITAFYDDGLIGKGYCQADSTAPVITSIPDTTGVLSELYSYDVDASGYPSPHYALLTNPAGMTIDSVTGLIGWTPSMMGDFLVSVEAYNSEGADTQSYTLHVTAPSDLVRIMPLGNSITRGAWGSPTDVGYRRSLYQQLAAAGHAVDFVGSQTDGSPDDFDRNHEGHDGWRDDQIASNVYGFLEVNPADIILLHIGTNSLDTSSADVYNILEEIDQYEADSSVEITVFLARIINRNPYSQTTTDFNDNVEAMAQARINAGDDIIIVDMEDGAGINYATDMDDEVHPNDTGYGKMADKWFSELDTYLSGGSVANLTLYGTPDSNLTTDDLICTYDLLGEAVTAATAWYVDGAPLMALYLPMEGGAANALSDYSGNGITAVANGNATWSAAAGHDGHGAFVLDGTGDDLSAGENFPTNSHYTKTAWVYRTGSGANGGNNIISGDENANGHALWAPDAYGNKLSGGHNQHWDMVQDTEALAISTWYFVALSYDNTTHEMTLYKNGVAIDSTVATGADQTVLDPTISIGSFGVSNGWMWQGAIDDPRIYTRVLTPEQIYAMYAAGQNIIRATETEVGDTWRADVTPFSTDDAGTTQSSNTLTVQPVTPEPPVITSTPDTVGTVGEHYTYDVDATGYPAPHYELLTYPAGMAVDSLTGVIDWTPAAAGLFDVSVRAYNSEGADTQGYVIDVSEPPLCPADMISYWKLDETSGTNYMDFYGGNDASASPSPPTPSVEAIAGGAQDFNGSNNYITAPDNGSFDWSSTASFSIECWCRFTTIGGKNKVMVGRDQGGGYPHWWLGARSSDGMPLFNLLDSSHNGDYCVGSTAINNDAWHHLVAVRDESADMNRLYVDGVKVDSVYYNYGAGFGATTQLDVGYMAYNGTPDYFYDGLLDEVAIYDRALTDTEILTHFTNGQSGIGYCTEDSIPPTITSTPDTTAEVGVLYSYDVNAIAYPAPHYALLTYPAGMTVDSLTGLVEWTPDTVGDYDVSVEAYNSEGADTQSYTIHVSPPSGLVKIMPLGNSITEGLAGSSDDTGYRRSLYLSLTGAGYVIDFVGSDADGIPTDFDRDHEGHGGWRADQIRDNIYGWLEAQDGPGNDDPVKIVLLHIGTNDISGGEDSSAVAAEIDQILDNIDLYETNYGAEITVFIARIINRSDPYSTYGLRTSGLNREIQSLADARIVGGDRIVVVDQETALIYPDDLADTVHPNDAGYGKMADRWFESLDPYLSNTPRIINLLLSATSPGNYTTDDLMASYLLAGNATTAATAWYVDGSPLMVAYLPMEGGAVNALLDYSGSGNDGTAAGDPTWNATGGFDGNGCFDFDGNDHIDLGSIFPTGPYTKTAWIRYVPGQSYNNIISGQTNHAFWVHSTGGAYRLTAGHNGNWDQVVDPSAFPENTWTFVAVTYDGTELKLYRNGAAVDSATSIPAITSDTRAYIGSFTDACCWFLGSIDEARIFNRALSSEQIAAMYGGGAGDHNTIRSPETDVGEDWQALVTPFSPVEAGSTSASNTITIQSGNPPLLTDLVLASTSGSGLTTDDLTCTYTLGGPAVTAATAWYVGGSPVMSLYLPMEGGASFALDDYSGNGITAVAHGDPAWSAAAGHDGHGAFVFDGNDDLGAGENFPTNSDYTKTAWVYRTGSGLNGGNNIISGDENPNGHALWAPDTYGNLLSGGHNQHWDMVQDTEALALSTWYFVALTYDNTTHEMILYKNGVAIDSTVATGDDQTVLDPTVSIGSFGAGNGWMWQGTIDDPRVYTHVLSPEQIYAMYAVGQNIIRATETGVGEEWQARVTPFSDSEPGATYPSNTITIVDQALPVITSTPDTTGYVGILYDYDVDASGSPAPYFALVTAPAEMVIDSVSGLIEWTPDSAGDFDVTVEAHNAAGADSQSFTIHVTEFTPPGIENLVLNATSPDTLTSDDLVCSFDLTGDAVTAATAWYRDGSPLMAFYLPMEGGEAIAALDYSGNGLGAATGDPSWLENGGHDGFGAFDFDGVGDHLVIPDAPSLDVDYVTLAAWIYVRSYLDDQRIISKEYGTGQPYSIYTLCLSGGGETKLQLRLGLVDQPRIMVTSNSDIPLDTWVHVAGIFDGSEVVLYIDGQPDTTMIAVGTVRHNDNPVYVGASQFFSPRFFDGVIDDARIYPYALPQEQIAALANDSSNVMKSVETSVGEVWRAYVTPFAVLMAGSTYPSNTATVQAESVPVITSAPDTTGTVGVPYSYDVEAEGVPAPEFGLLTSPAGMEIDSVSGVITWTPDAAGDFNVTVEAYNSAGADSQSYTITVATPAVPEIENLALYATSPDTLVTDDLICSYDLASTATTSGTTWYRNGSPLMILYLPMEGGGAGAVLDYSGNGITISTGGNPSWNSSGGHDGFGAYEFDGDDDLSAGDHFPAGSPYTKTAWVYRTGSGTGGGNSIVSGDEYSGGHMLWAPDMFGNRLSAGHNFNWSIVQDAVVLALDTWYFVAVTFDDATGKMKLYKDGAVVDSATTLEGVSDSTISIGSFGSGGGLNWEGRIDDARVYGHVLTPEQVMTLYTEGANRIDSTETDAGDVWQAYVTPFSAADAGSTYPSNIVTIHAPEAPEITSEPDTTVILGDIYSYDADAIGYPVPHYRLIAMPPEMVIDSLNGLIEWTPASTGVFGVAVEAYNVAGADTQVFDIGVHSAPLITSEPDTIATVGLLYSYDVEADGIPAPYYGLLVSPAGMVIDSLGGLIEWTPDAAGDFDVTIRAYNAAGADSQSYTIHAAEPLVPEIENLVLRSESDSNWTTDDLICEYDLAGSATTAAVAWYRNDAPLMLLYLPMEGGAANALLDLSGNARAVAAGGDPAWSADAGYDGHGACDFDGDDDLNAGKVLPSPSSYTKTAWVYRTSGGGNSIIAGDAASGGHVLWAPDVYGNVLSAGHGSSTDAVQDGAALDVDTWYFVAVTFDYPTGKMMLYKNGGMVDSATIMESVTDSTVTVGSYASGDAWYGRIDDVRLYAHALSPEQILMLYAEGAGRIDSCETDGGDLWQAHVTPFSATQVGATYESDTLRIRTITGFDDVPAPRSYALYPNIPNPFNPITVIQYDIPNNGERVILRVYDVSGRLVRTLVDTTQGAGRHSVTWDGKDGRGRNAASGVYFYHLRTTRFKETKKMVLLR